MDSVTNLEARLRAIEDRLEIQALAARFSDAVNGEGSRCREVTYRSVRSHCG